MKKREYPRPVFRKKMIKGLFWTGFMMMLFLSVVAIVRVGNAGAGADAQETTSEPTETNENLAISVGAQTFAENFATDYFMWENTDEGKKERTERLTPYLAGGLPEHAGLAFEGMEWNSAFTSSQVWKVEETGSDTANITLHVQHELNKTVHPDQKAIDQAKKEKKPLPEPKEEKNGPFEKYFVVPVKTDGLSYVVYQTPYYVPAPKKPDIAISTQSKKEEEVRDSVQQEKIHSFLNTFFKVYTTGNQDELSYYIEGDAVQSMSGVLTFQEVKDVLITKGDSQDQYSVYVTVIYVEDQSKAQIVSPYEMNMVKVEDRWLVKSIKNR
jgi:hypothetical protein